MDKIAVLIPCYNEELSIRSVIEDCKKYLPEATIYVYNNNSTDKTKEIALECGAVVRDEFVQGKGNVIRRMFREIDAECYLMVDGDNTYELSDAMELCNLVLEKKVDMVVGDRLSSTYFEENKRPFHNFGNSLVKFSCNRIYKSDVKDIMTGYRAFSYAFVKTFPVISKGFEIETEMTMHALDKNMYIYNKKIEYRDRQEGSFSKLNTYSDGMRVLKTIAKLYRCYKPLSYFMWFFFLFLFASIGFMIPVTMTYFGNKNIKYQDFYHAMGVFMMMIALMNLFTGIILDTLKRKQREEFELELIKADSDFKLKTK